jgi:hypothetical protein
MPYSVHMDKVVEACGSGDQALADSITERFDAAMTSADAQLGYFIGAGEPSHVLAVQHLILGDERSLDAALYSYGFKFMVQYFGHHLDNSAFYPASMHFLIEQVGPLLQQTGASVSLRDLLFRRPPIRLPYPDDFPLIGYWTAEEIQQSLELLQAFTPKSRELQAVLGWLEFAATRQPVEDIVGFYH